MDDVKVEARYFNGGPLQDEDDPFDLTFAPLRFSPQPISGFVEFRLRVPARLRKDLIPWRARDCGENFLVRTIYSAAGPSTMIVCLDQIEEPAGDVAVIVVREFLKRQFGSDAETRPTMLGPSPFHADCALDAGANGGFSHTRTPGEEKISLFTYDSNRYGSELNGLSNLHLELSHELGVFYTLTRYRNRRLYRATQVGDATQELIRAHRAQGLRSALSRLFGTGRLARELGLRVLSAELAVVHDREFARSLISGAYATDEVRAFRDNLELVAAEEFPAYLENAKQVVALLEGGRAKELEIAVLSAATLVGGAAGAAAALIAGA
ncbi:hypothetical protein [Blastococcus sp. TF02-09]|uniref:hypothetical protein n=1 Tax=Blastococcus sp. TF02-09 TaxID=2250576 RepID=UPI0011BE8534|nr:hypothetical protein [Blastococcus sp. TF02-9]